MKTFLKNLIKDVFRIFIIFFTIFIWVRYNSNDLKYSIILTSLLTLFVELILKLIAKKRGAKETLKASERKKMEDIMTTFAFKSTDYAVGFFFNMLSQKHACLKRKQFVLIETNKKKLQFLQCFRLKNSLQMKLLKRTLHLRIYQYQKP